MLDYFEIAALVLFAPRLAFLRPLPFAVYKTTLLTLKLT